MVPHLLEPLGAAGLVPPAVSPRGLAGGPLAGSAPLVRARLLEVVRLLYQHAPRPKEFIMKYRIQVSSDLAARWLAALQ